MTCGACSARLRQLLLISDGFARTRWGSAAAASASSLRFWTVARRIGCCVVGLFLPDSRRRAAVRRWQLLLLLYAFARGSAAARLRQRLVLVDVFAKTCCGSAAAAAGFLSTTSLGRDAARLRIGGGYVSFFSTISRGRAMARLRQRVLLLDDVARTRCGLAAAASGSCSTSSRGRGAARSRQRLGSSRQRRADALRLGCGSTWF